MRYENEPCCGCGEALCPASDDVVVCPDCGAPMHRRCWQAAGVCPQAAQHGEDFAWQPTIEPEEPAAPDFDPATQLGMLCPQCGENNPPVSRYCQCCGESVEETAGQTIFERMQQESLRREAQVRESFPAYVVNGRTLRMGDTVAGQPMEEISLQLRSSHRIATRYLTRFENGRRIGWNWAAFVFGPYWMFFRKLYKPGLVFAGIMLVLTFALMPMNHDLNERMFDGEAPSYSEIFQTANSSEAQQHMQDHLQAYRFHWLALGGLWLGTHVAAGLLGDDLLRRRIFGNIARLREREITFSSDNANAVESAAHRMGRHQMLLRLGGFSFFAPLMYFWAMRLLPSLIMEAIRLLVGG